MADTFVILAAGKGTRMGRDDLHKALLPLDGKAVLSHLIDLAPAGAQVVIALGHRASQIVEYVRMAHHGPQHVEFVTVDGWDGPRGGPGWSLLAAKERTHDDGDLYFTSCDTLWAQGSVNWQKSGSWLGVAPVPYGTSPARWCRVVGDHIVDKQPSPPGGMVHTGMGKIAWVDLPVFWEGLRKGGTVQGETQMSAGFKAISFLGKQRIDWLDVGDAAAYSRAVRLTDGYDWSKPGQATYLMPDRVVKWWADPSVSVKMAMRAQDLGGCTPHIREVSRNSMSMDWVRGAQSAYDAAVPMEGVLAWAEGFWRPRNDISTASRRAWAMAFYRDKTMDRIAMLRPELRMLAAEAVAGIDWEDLADTVTPSTIHGDLTYANVLQDADGALWGIDWRPDFAGEPWGDLRYDLAKLLTSTRIHWDAARHGDFRAATLPGADLLVGYAPYVRLLAGLCCLNSAPLHGAPFDELLVWRGLDWIQEEGTGA